MWSLCSPSHYRDHATSPSAAITTCDLSTVKQLSCGQFITVRLLIRAVSSPGDPLDELSIPDGTTVEEHDIVTDSDVLIGSNSTLEFGIRSRSIAAGERVQFGRHLEVDTDCRLDMLCEVDDSVLVGADAYIGARCHIGGALLVSGDLDIGDDVEIDEGFETNGWIHTRNPVPALVFYFIVLSQFLRFGDEKKAQEFASAISPDDVDQRPPLVVPRGAELSDDAWRVSTPATIGDDCRIHGNIRAESITVGTGTTVFGSLRARDDITVDAETVIIGDVTTRNGTVTLHAGAEVRGDISCQDLVVHEGADVDGSLRANGEMKLVRKAARSTADTASSEDEGTDTGASAASTGDDAGESTETNPEQNDSPDETDGTDRTDGTDGADGTDRTDETDGAAETDPEQTHSTES